MHASRCRPKDQTAGAELQDEEAVPRAAAPLPAWQGVAEIFAAHEHDDESAMDGYAERRSETSTGSDAGSAAPAMVRTLAFIPVSVAAFAGTRVHRDSTGSALSILF